MKALILLVIIKTPAVSNLSGYLTGALIALLILGYLLYSLIKPEKF